MITVYSNYILISRPLDPDRPAMRTVIRTYRTAVRIKLPVAFFFFNQQIPYEVSNQDPMGPVQTWVTLSNPSWLLLAWLQLRQTNIKMKETCLKSSRKSGKITRSWVPPALLGCLYFLRYAVMQCKSKIRFIGQKKSFSTGSDKSKLLQGIQCGQN